MVQGRIEATLKKGHRIVVVCAEMRHERLMQRLGGATLEASQALANAGSWQAQSLVTVNLAAWLHAPVLWPRRTLSKDWARLETVLLERLGLGDLLVVDDAASLRGALGPEPLHALVGKILAHGGHVVMTAQRPEDFEPLVVEGEAVGLFSTCF